MYVALILCLDFNRVKIYWAIVELDRAKVVDFRSSTGSDRRLFCLPPEGQEVVNLVVVGVLGIISFFSH